MADKKNQEAIDRALRRLEEAKAIASNPQNRGTQAEKDAWRMSNEARAELEKYGVDHNSGYMAKGTSYDTFMQGRMSDMWRQQADAMYQQQASQIEQATQNQITAIQKAYADAVAQGKLSQEEAERQFQDNVNAINEMAYRDAQITNLTATDRGIANSQQMLGLMAGDNARKNSNITTARTSRDARINEIKTRLDTIKQQRDLDLANIEAQRDQALIGARAGLDAQLFGQLANFQQGNYQLGLQNRYQQDNMRLQQQFDLEKMSEQQRHALEQMDKQLEHDLKKMKTAHGYDLEKMDKQFGYDLQKMTKQFGYDMSKISAQHQNQLAQISASKKAQLEAMNREYELQKQRVLAQYTPGTDEYKIRMAQLEETFDQQVKSMHTQAMYESLNTIMTPEQPYYSQWMNRPQDFLGGNVSFGNDLQGNTIVIPNNGAPMGKYNPNAKTYSQSSVRPTIDWNAPPNPNLYFHAR